MSYRLGDVIEDRVVQVYDPERDLVTTASLHSHDHLRTVLFFYPADFSVICPTELQKLNEQFKAFEHEQARVYVVSRDSLYSHKAWVELEQKLNGFTIPMVSDRKGELGELFGCTSEQTGEYERATFIISGSGELVYVEISPVYMGRNITELLRKVRALNYRREHPEAVCPEGWLKYKEQVVDTLHRDADQTNIFTP